MPDVNFSLIKLDGLSELGCKLIKAVGRVMGVLYEPTRIRRKAKAIRDAIAMISEVHPQNEEINIRAHERFVNRELRRQYNIEAIVRMALEVLPEEGSGEPLDEDWIANFFASCEDISDNQMQTLWAHILAGETARPGRYSRRALQFVKALSRNEAENISEYYRYIWEVEEAVGKRRMVFMNSQMIHLNAPSKRRISEAERHVPFVSHDMRLQMKTLGIAIVEQGLTVKLKREYAGKYGGRRFKFGGRGGSNPESIEVDILTEMGEELISVCNVRPSEEYLEACIHQMQLENLE